jgi:hypothetical protein
VICTPLPSFCAGFDTIRYFDSRDLPAPDDEHSEDIIEVDGCYLLPQELEATFATPVYNFQSCTSVLRELHMKF